MIEFQGQGITSEQHFQFIKIIESYLGPWFYPRTRKFHDTISQMIAMNKRVVAYYYGKQCRPT